MGRPLAGTSSGRMAWFLLWATGALLFFLPAFARCLTIPQLLCLCGFHPTLNKKVFKQAEDMRPSDMSLLIGNSMGVPVVGHVMAVALGIISPAGPSCCPNV